jgi:hypothetical protein
MKYRKLGFLLVLVPGLAMAQERSGVAAGCSASDPAATPDNSRSAARGLDGTNAITRAVLLANRPKGISEADWLKLMVNPVNATLYPLCITQAMLDTLDAGKLDLRYRYVLVR